MLVEGEQKGHVSRCKKSAEGGVGCTTLAGKDKLAFAELNTTNHHETSIDLPVD